MKIEDLKKLDKNSLTLKIEDCSKKLLALSVKKTMGGLEKPHEIKLLKRERALIKTVLSYK